MTEPTGIEQDELEAQAGEPLPDREAMSLIALDDAMVMPPPDDGSVPPDQSSPPDGKEPVVSPPGYVPNS